MPRPVRLTMLTLHTRIISMAQRRVQILEWVDRAGRQGTDLVLMPELADHHRTREGIDAFAQGKAAVHETLGFTLDSPWLQQIAALAHKHKMVVIPCVIQNDGPRMYKSAIVIGADGSVLGSYKATHLPDGEKVHFDCGARLDPIATPLGKLGIFICWDIHFPEITRVYELKGADILLWSTMRHQSFQRDLYQSVLPARCITHALPMGVATYVAEDQLLHRQPMNSVIIDGFGSTVAGPMQNDDGLVCGVIDLDVRPVIQKQWDDPTCVDYARHVQSHRRPELYDVLTAPNRKFP